MSISLYVEARVQPNGFGGFFAGIKDFPSAGDTKTHEEMFTSGPELSIFGQEIQLEESHPVP